MTRITGLRPRRVLVSLDILRFAAAGGVMLHHYTGRWGVLEALNLSRRTPLSESPWLRSGWVGVEIFFVISGYVIAMSAENTTASDFIRRRALRLWPAALICSTITALLLLATGLQPDVII